MAHSRLVVVGWDKFQHYRVRRPVWIKNYVDLLRRDEYLGLTGHRRAILHGLWMEYATCDARLTLDTRSLSRRLQLRVTMSDMEALNHAGFVLFLASNPLASRSESASAEKETYKEAKAVPLARTEGQRPKLTISETIKGSLKEAL